MFTRMDHRQQQQPPAARCAVALNNIRCVLFEKGCHEQARATFQDAILVVERLVEAAAECKDDDRCRQHPGT
jgi:hypothetical protein